MLTSNYNYWTAATYQFVGNWKVIHASAQLILDNERLKQERSVSIHLALSKMILIIGFWWTFSSVTQCVKSVEQNVQEWLGPVDVNYISWFDIDYCRHGGRSIELHNRLVIKDISLEFSYQEPQRDWFNKRLIECHLIVIAINSHSINLRVDLQFLTRISQHYDHNLEEVCLEHGHNDVGIEFVVQEAEIDAAYVNRQLSSH